MFRKATTKFCIVCGKKIPSIIWIGKIRKLVGRRRTKCFECSPFNSKSPAETVLDKNGTIICAICRKLLTTEQFKRYIPRGQSKYKTSRCCKRCSWAYKKAKLRQFKLDCINYKGGCCQKCGYNKCNDALHFHHVNRAQKRFSICDCTITRITNEVRLELDKCQLLCANCHAEEEHIHRRKKDTTPDLIVASYNHITVPSKEWLQQLVFMLSRVDICKVYQIGKKTLNKWIKDLSVEMPVKRIVNKFKPPSNKDKPNCRSQPIPDRDELESLVKRLFVKDICKFYRVNHRTFKRWIAHHNIQIPERRGGNTNVLKGRNHSKSSE